MITLTLSSRADSVRFSLRTDAPDEVKQRQAAAVAYLTQVWKSLRSNIPASLTHRQATALAGELFRSWADDMAARSTAIERTPEGVWKRVDSELDQERIAEWSAVVAQWDKALENGDPAKLEPTLGPIADRLLMRKGIGQLDRQSRTMLLESLGTAVRDAFKARHRQASGDYSTDLSASRFPEWPVDIKPQPSRARDGRSVSLANLVTEWWREAELTGLKASTHESYRNTMAKFVAFLGHDDTDRVTKDDVLRFKQHRLSSGVSPKTVKDSDLAGLKTLFGWAVANNKLSENPAAGATLKIGRQQKLRSKAFSDSEARAILKHARDYRPTKESKKLGAVKRWVPWLCAFTGARVGEMLQLRKQDIRYEGEICVILITPEAGTVKSNEAREVVLHPQIIEEGFNKFVELSEAGHLFITPRPRDGDLLAPIKTARNKLGAFVREVVSDPNVDPSHAWRHRFKTVGREVGIADTVLDAIQGHMPKSIGDSYGDVTTKARANAIRQFPRYEFED